MVFSILIAVLVVSSIAGILAAVLVVSEHYLANYGPCQVTINQVATAHYLQALEMRRLGHEAVAIFSGKIPHSVGIVPGGVTDTPTVDKITAMLWKVKKLQDFVTNVYLPDVMAIAGVYSDYLEIGAGCMNLLSYGGYDLQGDDADLT